ncbi:YtxH domain-containing protein [Paenibacillus solisilvae]|uniref:YtxH domain-containing protein n=1 Tax=Paenibacillus solisilvae TaxID=2486751 RepID=A0ABW0VTP5_9BACL
MAKNKNARNFLLGAIAGGVAGSVTALLLAPKAGRELRKDIVVSAQQVSERTVHIAGQVGGTTTRIAKQVSESATDFAGKAKDTASNVIDSVRNWRSLRNDEELDDISDEAGNLLEADSVESALESDVDKSELQTVG